MCGRYALRSSTPRIAEMLGVEARAEIAPRYNIAPTQPVPVCRERAGRGRELVTMRWGLLPGWVKEARSAYQMINARAETLLQRPAFRGPFRYRRCLIPADGFYEWKVLDGRKQPCFVCLRDERPFCFAGLWEQRTDEEGELLESCTIITTRANRLLRDIHERMPVILEREDHARWLDPHRADTDSLLPLLVPYPAERMSLWPVSQRVNSPRHDDEACVTPIEPPAGPTT